MFFSQHEKPQDINSTISSSVKKPWSSVFDFVGIWLFFIAVYSPVLTKSWAYHDDYIMWRNPRCGPCENFLVFQWLMALGRSVGAYITCGIWKLVHNFNDARVAHFLMVLLLSIFAWIFALWLKKHAIHKTHAMLLAAAIFTLPAFQIHTAYILSSPNILGALLSAYAAMLSYKALFNTATLVRKTIFVFIAVGILFSVLHIHTSGALFFWPMIAVPFICVKNQVLWKEKWRYLSLIGISIAAQLSYYLVYTLLYLPKYNSDYGGKIFKTLPLEKIVWFFQVPLLNALNLWNIFPSWQIGTVVAMGILAGFLFKIRYKFFQIDARKKKDKPYAARTEIASGFFKVALLLVLLPLSVAPYLVIEEDLCFYRGLIGLGPLIVLLLFYSIRNLQCLFLNTNSNKIMTVFLVAACLTGACFAFLNIKNQIIYPQKVEISYIKKILSETDLRAIRQIHVIGYPVGVPLYGKAVRGDEFGVSPTSFHWDVEGIIRASILELQKDNENDSFIVTHGIYSIWDTMGLLIIDMRKLRSPQN